MTTAHKLTVAALVFVAAIAVWIGAVAIQVRDAKLHAEDVASSADKDKAEAVQQIAALQQRMNVRDASDAKQQSQTAELIKSVQTIAQIKAQLPQLITLPSAPQQISAQQAAQINAASLPDAPKVQAGDIVVSQADAKPMFDKLAQCSADEKSLTACSADRTDQANELAEQKKETADEQQKAAAWEKAAKGGSIVHRILVTARDLGIGAAVGYAVARERK